MHQLTLQVGVGGISVEGDSTKGQKVLHMGKVIHKGKAVCKGKAVHKGKAVCKDEVKLYVGLRGAHVGQNVDISSSTLVKIRTRTLPENENIPKLIK